MSKIRNNRWKKGHRSPSSSEDAILAIQTAYSFIAGVHVHIDYNGEIFTATVSWRDRFEIRETATLQAAVLRINGFLRHWGFSHYSGPDASGCVSVSSAPTAAMRDLADAFLSVCETNTRLIKMISSRLKE